MGGLGSGPNPQISDEVIVEYVRKHPNKTLTALRTELGIHHYRLKDVMRRFNLSVFSHKPQY